MRPTSANPFDRTALPAARMLARTPGARARAGAIGIVVIACAGACAARGESGTSGGAAIVVVPPPAPLDVRADAGAAATPDEDEPRHARLSPSSPSPPPASGVRDDEARAAARALASQGLALFEAGDFAGALARFDSARRLFPAPTLELYVARAQLKLGRTTEARATLRALARQPQSAAEPAAFAKARAEAAALEQSLGP